MLIPLADHIKELGKKDYQDLKGLAFLWIM